MSARAQIIERVKSPGVYGLLTLDTNGEVKRYSWLKENFRLKPDMTVTQYFEWLGWYFVEGAGFYDKDRNLAEAYYNNEFIPYPRWY